MHTNDSDDKNHLAMLAVPVILSMLLSFSGDVLAVERTMAESTSTEQPDFEDREITAVADEIPTAAASRVGQDDPKAALHTAVANGDYKEFLMLTKGMPFAEVMTEPAFRTLSEQYTYSRGSTA